MGDDRAERLDSGLKFLAAVTDISSYANECGTGSQSVSRVESK